MFINRRMPVFLLSLEGGINLTLFTGSGVAIVTPFHEDNSVNYEAYEKLINFQIENGTDAIISCGTTGEASTLTDEEQLAVIAFAVKTANKRVPVIAGAGSNNTAHGVELCRGCQEAGADACLVVTPYYNKATQKGLVAHFTAQAKSVDIPLLLYNVPSRTGLHMMPQTVAELAKVPNIVGIKEASGDIVHVAKIAELCGEDFDIYSGDDNNIVPMLSLGGKGVISVIANIAPRQTHDLVMRYLEGDHKGSLKLQLEMLPLVRALFSEVSPTPVKTALNLMGLQAGGTRMPLIEMEESNRQTLIKAMENYGLLH